jgi:hypothetical protein
MTDLPVIAEGQLATGERWSLSAGGTSRDFYTFLETVRPDGSRDSGGMGGPPLYPGSLLNTYTGGSDHGLRRVLVRADPSVATLRVNREGAEPAILRPVAERRDLGVVFFAALLPRTAVLESVTALDEAGHELEQPDLSRHEEGWQRFRRRPRP